MALKENPFATVKKSSVVTKKKKYTRASAFKHPENNPNTISSDTVLDEAVSGNTVSSRQKTVSGDLVKTVSNDTKTISNDTPRANDTIFKTVSKKEKPSLLELMILKEMFNNSAEDGVSNFQTRSLAEKVGTTIGGARNALNRIRSKGLAVNKGFQKGNSVGYTSYKITEKGLNYLKETISRNIVLEDTVSKNIVSETILHNSKKVSNHTYINLITEKLKEIGLKEFHLKMHKGSIEELEEQLIHYEHSLINNEIKSPNKLALLIKLIKENKPWVSESFLQTIKAELDANNKRVEEYKRIQEEKEIMAFKNWKKQHQEEELKALVPEEKYKKLHSPGHDAELKKIFRDQRYSESK